MEEKEGIEIKKEIWKEFYEELEIQKEKKPGKSKINNSNSLEEQTGFMNVITSQIKISELAKYYLINNRCPDCQKYSVNFDDFRGWFCCQGRCGFKGNLVDFIFKCRRNRK